jgi:hypothetical protein
MAKRKDRPRTAEDPDPTAMRHSPSTRTEHVAPVQRHDAVSREEDDVAAPAPGAARRDRETDPSQPSTAGERTDEDRTEEIRRRAWHRYENRGRGDGQDLQDWLDAERDVAHLSRVGRDRSSED